MEDTSKLQNKFPAFPYEPYPIQIDFMNALYGSLAKGGVAVLESPTGTGKTLSIICSALQWLIDQKQKQSKDPASLSISDDEPDWIREFASGSKKDVSIPKSSIARKIDKSRKHSLHHPDLQKIAHKNTYDGLDLEEAECLLEDYTSEDDLQAKRLACESVSSSDEEESAEGDNEEEMEELKVYYCSRTHSQLSQFVKEFRKANFSVSLNVACLGSRKKLCINDDVLKLDNSVRINETCLDMQKIKLQGPSKMQVQNDGKRTRVRKTSLRCPMLGKKILQKKFRKEASMLHSPDIEDLVKLGMGLGTCPYYSSLSMIRGASLVVLPYQSLLLKSSRESLGLPLQNNVVIIDEAHNLTDSLTSMYKSKISLSQLEEVHMHLDVYLEKFKNRLGDGNRRYIQILMVVIKAFIKTLQENAIVRVTSGERVCNYSLAINELLFAADIDNINLVKLHKYMKESKIAYKVSSYRPKGLGVNGETAFINNGSDGYEGSIISGFQALANFLMSLTNSNIDGRVIVSRSEISGLKESYLKYIMLDGAKLFNEIIDQVHAVVLAGGTLQPIEEMRERLFPNLSPDRFHFFSCNHIIPPESILPIVVAKGPSGVSFDFSYSSRNSISMIEELGRLICNLVGIVPEGIVIFFSSFDYIGQVYDVWKASGILSRIMKKKTVFREPRNSSDVEDVLEQYKAVILSPSVQEKALCHGALLLAVVGGKMSEGINFSDGMGRCVVMVGLPYPSAADIELIERLKHIEGVKGPNILDMMVESESSIKDAAQSGFDVLRICKKRGREYYENLCMKAVNQSIGRAIRHIEDYAAILLVDSRYSIDASNWGNCHPVTKLPSWIRNRLFLASKNYGEVHRLLSDFFQHKKSKLN